MKSNVELKHTGGVLSRGKIKPSDKRQSAINIDNDMYLFVWGMHPEHRCEECDKYLGDSILDDSGRILNRSYFSHILGKGAYPEFRLDIRNFNLLCLECHRKWEDTSNRESMKIYKNNKIIMDLLISERNESKRQ